MLAMAIKHRTLFPVQVDSRPVCTPDVIPVAARSPIYICRKTIDLEQVASTLPKPGMRHALL